MESIAGPWMSSLKYCSVTTAQKSPCCINASAQWNPFSICPLFLQVPCFIRHPSTTRCDWSQPDLQPADPEGNGPGLLEGLQNDGTSVLARKESDGFYHRAQLKPTLELGRKDKLLVEFEAPHSTDPKDSAQLLQSTVPEDVIQHSWALKHSLLPGDKVLAPWEPKQERFGPGTVVQGLETRDRQRASEDEEITVCFWNGKMVKVPLGVAIWISPAHWEKAMEMLHKPLTSCLKPGEHLGTVPWAPPCPLLGSALGYTMGGLLLGSFLYPPRQVYPPLHNHCPLLPDGCPCYCSLSCRTWWPLTSTLEATNKDHPEPKLRSTTQLLELDSPKDKKVAAHAWMNVTSSSSSSYSFSPEEEDLGSDPKKVLPQRVMVDSTVNTDASLFEKPQRQKDISRPRWKYWKRNGLEPSHRRPGKETHKKLIDP
ncbi:uncharacterized protein C11orf16 homolog [Monodelphis domestica]|uniref:uncharacterized protein C11orf16 homolog n=1 Tax=Monodelphis domestica TaxID=13616 RepID=UPI0024E23933|nr:uncharacterized protein C11orf16 homolog [Monodelphis domestica]